MLRDVPLTLDWSLVLLHTDPLSLWGYRRAYRWQVTLKSLAGVSPFSLRRSVRDTFGLSPEVRAWAVCTVAAATRTRVVHPERLLHLRDVVAHILPNVHAGRLACTLRNCNLAV